MNLSCQQPGTLVCCDVKAKLLARGRSNASRLEADHALQDIPLLSGEVIEQVAIQHKVALLPVSPIVSEHNTGNRADKGR